MEEEASAPTETEERKAQTKIQVTIPILFRKPTQVNNILTA